MTQNFIIYTDQNKNVNLKVFIKDETIWLVNGAILKVKLKQNKRKLLYFKKTQSNDTKLYNLYRSKQKCKFKSIYKR